METSHTLRSAAEGRFKALAWSDERCYISLMIMISIKSIKAGWSAARQLAIALCAVLTMGAATAHAAPSQPHSDVANAIPEPVLTHDLSEEELGLVSARSADIFGHLIIRGDGGWVVSEASADTSGVTSVEWSSLADGLNHVTTLDQPTSAVPLDSSLHSVSSPGYRNCVINATGLSALIGAAGAGGSQLAYLIAAQNWKEVAFVIVRLVGVNAVRGGAAGLLAALVGAGVWCATPFAG